MEQIFSKLEFFTNGEGFIDITNDLNLFIDYYAPYEAVSIIHMVAQDKMRDNKKHKIAILDEKDNFIQKSLRYSENIN